MDFFLSDQLEKRKQVDVLVLPFWKGEKKGEWAIRPHSPFSFVESLLQTGDFKGREGELICLYPEGQIEARVFLLGLGEKEKVSLETLRRCYGTVAKLCLNKKFKSLNLVTPNDLPLLEEQYVRGMAEGLLLANSRVDRYKSKEEERGESALIQKAFLIGATKTSLNQAKKAAKICEGVYLARELVNQNADDITPAILADYAKSLGKQFKNLKVSVFDKKRIEKEKLGLLLAVNRGSILEPRFILLEYKGNSKSKDHTVIVGKGITYDTGGLNLKAAGMEFMKCDMAGAAACLGTLLALCELKLKVNVTAVIPSTENCISPTSFKPGDVYQSHAGKTVEIMNTDAEGRLILADALSYSCQHLHPTRIIDFATLTGAMEIILGPEASGMMCNHNQLAIELSQAGETTGERVWRLPLYEEYKDRLKSDIADLKNWNGRSGGANVAATFLQAFVKDGVPWAHLDIASTAFPSDPKKYQPKYASGVGVRFMIEFLEQLITPSLKSSK